MKKDYTIQRCDLIKGCRWIVLKRINKNVQMHVYAGFTKKECEAWLKEEIESKRKNEKRKNKH